MRCKTEQGKRPAWPQVTLERAGWIAPGNSRTATARWRRFGRSNRQINDHSKVPRGTETQNPAYEGWTTMRAPEETPALSPFPASLAAASFILERLHLWSKTEGKMSFTAVFEPQVHTDLVRAFRIVADVIELKRFAGLRRMFFSLRGQFDEILASLALRQRFKKRDQFAQSGRAGQGHRDRAGYAEGRSCCNAAFHIMKPTGGEVLPGE